MENLIGKPVIFETIRKPMRDKSLKPIFPEHVFSATILQFMGDYALIENIKLLVSEGEHKNITYLIKVANNMYFNVYIYNQNIDLLNSIQNHRWFPKLYDLCFYQLSTIEISFTRELFNI
jgi:hypothetical protein